VVAVMTLTLIGFDYAEKTMVFIGNTGSEEQIIADEMKSP
jgi:hypothetical protein